MTFIPYESFVQSAKVIDNKRLWKEILETNQLCKAIYNHTDFYKNHPIRKMWEKHYNWLEYYKAVFVQEWLDRRLFNPFKLERSLCLISPETRPKWLGNEQLHASHRASLLFKNPQWYSQFNWKETPKIEYFWPI